MCLSLFGHFSLLFFLQVNEDEIEYAHNSRTITLHTEMKRNCQRRLKIEIGHLYAIDIRIALYQNNDFFTLHFLARRTALENPRV